MGISSQSKQHMVSPVKNLVPFSSSKSFTLRRIILSMILHTLNFYFVRMAVIAFLLSSSFFINMCLNFE